jgi:hypothetical protein
MIPIVDVSDTPPASGNTKRISINNLLSSSPTASGALTVTGLVTAGSATITGDLTVDTSTLKVDSTNNRVGIGTATPGAPLDIFTNNLADAILIRGNDNANVRIRMVNSGAGGEEFALSAGIPSASNSSFVIRSVTAASNRYVINQTGEHAWATNAGTAMTLNSTGLGVGVTPSAWSSPYKCVQLNGGSLSVYPSTDIYLSQNAYNSGGWKRVAAGYASQYIQTNSEHRFLIAGTDPTVDSAIAFTTAMTLDANGRLLIGKTASALGTVGLEEAAGGYIQATVTSDASLFCNRLATDGETIKFYRQTLQVGNISVTTTATAYNTSSDYRLKESVQPLVGGLTRVNALKPSVYNWKSNGSAGEGFLAHELADIVPAAVTGEKDSVNADGSIKPQGVDMSRIVPILVAAIQELTARVQTLESR